MKAIDGQSFKSSTGSWFEHMLFLYLAKEKKKLYLLLIRPKNYHVSKGKKPKLCITGITKKINTIYLYTIFINCHCHHGKNNKKCPVLIYKLHTLPIMIFYFLHLPFIRKMKPNINKRRQHI